MLDETRHFYYSQVWQVIEERVDGTADTDVEAQHVWGHGYVDELILRDRDTERFYALQDANFRVTAIVDDNGTVAERYAYTAYGQRTALNPNFTAHNDPANGSYGFAIGHQGLMHDEESGLVYNRRRMLHPTIGRFVQRDSLGYVDGMNLYQYLRSNPFVFTDTLGTQAEEQDCDYDEHIDPERSARTVATRVDFHIELDVEGCGPGEGRLAFRRAVIHLDVRYRPGDQGYIISPTERDHEMMHVRLWRQAYFEPKVAFGTRLANLGCLCEEQARCLLDAWSAYRRYLVHIRNAANFAWDCHDYGPGFWKDVRCEQAASEAGLAAGQYTRFVDSARNCGVAGIP